MRTFSRSVANVLQNSVSQILRARIILQNHRVSILGVFGDPKNQIKHIFAHKSNTNMYNSDNFAKNILFGSVFLIRFPQWK